MGAEVYQVYKRGSLADLARQLIHNAVGPNGANPALGEGRSEPERVVTAPIDA